LLSDFHRSRVDRHDDTATLLLAVITSSAKLKDSDRRRFGEGSRAVMARLRRGVYRRPDTKNEQATRSWRRARPSRRR
jgi:hypothetical protein